jgi:hypothetical protein
MTLPVEVALLRARHQRGFPRAVGCQEAVSHEAEKARWQKPVYGAFRAFARQEAEIGAGPMEQIGLLHDHP